MALINPKYKKKNNNGAWFCLATCESNLHVGNRERVVTYNKRVSYKICRSCSAKAHERLWTKEEDNFIINNHFSHENKWIAEKLNRTLNAVRTRAHDLKIRKTKPWTEEEDNFLIKNYNSLGAKEIAKILNKTIHSIHGRTHILGLYMTGEEWSNIYTKKHDISNFTKVERPEVAYILGILWADGHVTPKKNQVRLGLVSSDIENIKEFYLNEIKYNYTLCVRKPYKPSHQPWTTITCSNRDLHTFLKEHDYVIKSSSSPEKILKHIPEHLHNYWWRGYFDGDGCLGLNKSYHHPHVSLASGGDQDWNFAITLCNTLNIAFHYKTNYFKLGRNSVFQITGIGNCRRFLDYIYNGKEMGLKRKYEKYLLLKNKCIIPPPKSSKFRGVTFAKNINKYNATIYKNKQRFNLGYFITEEEAALAYNTKSIELFGEQAMVNV